MGYAVKAGLFSAAEVGASHNRERLFILAYNNGDGRDTRGSCISDGRIQNNKKRNDKSIFQDGTQSQFRTCKGDKYVANSSSERGKWRMLQRTCKQKCEEEIDKRDYALGIPVWPPMPNDKQAWSEIPNNLKPSVLRVADGLANRLDRIRACGNGVVPLVAAYAWRTLAADLELKWDNY
jgi:DNA (cytosine-5)-methyltransferase 1